MTARVLPLRPLDRLPEEPSDESLIIACAGGDSRAFGLLFDRHHVVLTRFLARLSGSSSADLEDLVQQTFLTVFRSAARYRQGSSVRTWILGIAVNVSRHHARQHRRRRSLLARAMEEPLPMAPPMTDTVEHQELLGRVYAALEQLPPEQRSAFVMCDLEELRGVDAARTLGIPEGTLWRRLHDARKSLLSVFGGGEK
jgi:RNA polymerase sigma-70 factor, ECF subfamily